MTWWLLRSLKWSRLMARNSNAILDAYTNIRKNYISVYNTYSQCATIAATKPPIVCATTAFDVKSR